ncbi:MAG: T9SS type A sorting domain-containing protein [Melioribacteraceae bacterium]|nr:T9SS type A sorting domain-containing protein [Melioribacteraceae bacterium]MCF8355478.1 T9SS type A sorting domain-containing protein [Melioribacteraceae bacterium]MCF8394903.1 T9SS type A sorting domain-containing protein [Melioribacteraceae bacterium]MCF8420455.1 T9SS type A sorting domain-containing protein [Melioribacteraceae bacterium]
MNKSKLICLFLFFASMNFAQFTNYQVNEPSSTDPEEVVIAINTAQPNILAAGANINYLFRSSNSGRRWNESQMSSTLGVWGDPCLIFDGLGNLFYAHLSNPIDGYWIDRIVVQKSTDNGGTWDNGIGVGLTYPKNQDKEWLAVDLTDSPYRNNVYMSWTEFDDYASWDTSDSSRILFSRSTDHGGTWMTPVRLSDHGGNCIDSDETVEGAVPAVGPNGEVYVAWSGPLGIMFDKSLDGGITFGNDIFVVEHVSGWDLDVPGINRCNGMPVTGCDISDSPYNGNIYVMWGDQRETVNNTDVYLIKSTDGGETWDGMTKINDDNTERHQFFPWMKIDPVTGIIYVVFYDRRNTVGAATDVYIARSDDGGDTFTNHKVNTAAFTPNDYIFFGDYINIDAYDGKIYPIWTKMVNYTLSVWIANIDDTDLITGIDDDTEIVINEYQLYQNYPNPFNPKTTIGYQIPTAGNVKIFVRDMLGKEITVLVDEYKSPGLYEVSFDGSELSSGVYFYTIVTKNFIETKKAILIK